MFTSYPANQTLFLHLALIILPTQQTQSFAMIAGNNEMNTILKSLLAASIIVSCSLGAMAAEIAKSPLATHASSAQTKSDEISQKERFLREREAMHQSIMKMTPEQRAAKREEMRERFNKLPPEEQQSIRQTMREDRKAMGEHWKTLPPQERAERREEMRRDWKNMSHEARTERRKEMREHWDKMPPQEREARRQAMREHWERMSPQERENFKSEMRARNGMPPPPLAPMADERSSARK